MESFENHKLPVLRDRDATDPARIVRWAKEALTCGQAHPKVLEKYNLLRFCVSEEVREMWAALTDDVEGAPADDYPEDINIDSTDTEELAKKRDWHVEWLQAVISYYSTSQQDSVYDAVRQHVAWTGGKDKPTLNAIAEWALSCARAEKAVAPEAWNDADPKALFAACAKVLPEAIRTCSRTSPRVASTLGRLRPSSLTSAPGHAKRTTPFELQCHQRVVKPGISATI